MGLMKVQHLKLLFCVDTMTKPYNSNMKVKKLNLFKLKISVLTRRPQPLPSGHRTGIGTESWGKTFRILL